MKKKEVKVCNSVRVYPRHKKKLIRKHGSLQQFIDKMIEKDLKEKK